ncbi:hypothetical protein [Paraburkholderia phenoliruptrix]|uniref:hypothetical protein n=1 Tax=Paraburkholderia phenoliruptrix TaxID=252970 RepID=UPI0034CD8DC3
MSGTLKAFCEHPIIFTLAVLVYFALCWVAMKIGFAVMIFALKAMAWVVPKLDSFSRAVIALL